MDDHKNLNPNIDKQSNAGTWGQLKMDFAQSKMNQELEEALFSWEEQRLFQKEISLETLLLSYPALNKNLPRAIE